MRAVVRYGWILAAHMAILTLGRAALALMYSDEFAGLSRGDLAAAFVRGLMFDASIVSTFVGFPALMLVLPFGWSQTRAWQLLWSRLCLLALIGSLVLVVSDLGYFGLLGRHIGPELATVGPDLDMLAATAVRDHLPLILGLVVMVVLVVHLWKRLERWDQRGGLGARPPWPLAILFLPLLVLAARGGVSGKPINIVNAFESTVPLRGLLELNAPFNLYHSLRNTGDLKAHYMPEDQALASARALFIGAEEVSDDPELLPLQRHRPASGQLRPNVVVLLLESWGAGFVDSMRTRDGLEPLGATPHFDALAERGLLFTRMFAAGQLSLEGVTALLAGFPKVPGIPFIGRGIEQNELSYLGRIAKQAGYRTHFLQSSKRGSFRMDAIAAMAGFDRYMGMEDIRANTGHEPMGKWGAWDEDLLAELHRLNTEGEEPFLGLAFTATTHEPFMVPDGFEQRFDPDMPHAAFLESLAYADECLGRFLARAEEAGYLENTIFLVVADHVGRGMADRSDPLELFRIPCLLVGPGIEPGVNDAVAGQTDLLPTLCDAAGWEGSYSAFGRSLLRPLPDTHGALCCNGGLLVRVERGGWIRHNLRKRVEASPATDGFGPDAAAARLEAIVQTAATLLQRNRVFKNPDG